MDMSKLGAALLKAGAPLLRNLVVDAVGGGIKGRIAGSVIDALADNLGVSSTTPEKLPDAIARKIEADPESAAPVVRQVQEEFVSVVDVGSGDLTAYLDLVREDGRSEGILSRIWRPFFALVFTFCYGIVIVTVCYLMLNRELATLNQLQEVTGFLTFAFVAGCAVLGVQIWKRTEEKKSGLS